MLRSHGLLSASTNPSKVFDVPGGEEKGFRTWSLQRPFWQTFGLNLYPDNWKYQDTQALNAFDIIYPKRLIREMSGFEMAVKKARAILLLIAQPTNQPTNQPNKQTKEYMVDGGTDLSEPCFKLGSMNTL